MANHASTRTTQLYDRRRAKRRISPTSGKPTPLEGRDTTFAELVVRLSRCVRQDVLLEARLAAGACDRPAAHHDHPPRQHATQHAAAHAAPASVTADRICPEQVEDDSRADAARSVPEILAGVCADWAPPSTQTSP